MTRQERAVVPDDALIEAPTRRQVSFMLFLTALFAEGSAAFVLRRLLENAKVQTGISDSEYSQNIEAAAQYDHPIEFAMHLDFSNPNDAWVRYEQMRALELTPKHIGIFCTVQQIDNPSTKASLRDLISQIHAHGGTALINLGAGQEKLEGNPFAFFNEVEMTEWIEKWAVFLVSMGVPMDVRFLFEPNVFGYVAYGMDQAFSRFPQLHAQRYQYLFTKFRNRIIQLSPKNGQRLVTVSACLSSASSDLDTYWPIQPMIDYGEGVVEARDGIGVDGIGVDIFDFRQMIYNIIMGEQHMEEEAAAALRSMKAAQEKIRSLTGVDVPMRIYEIGSLNNDIEWIKKISSQFLAEGGEMIGWLDFNKENQGATERDWRMFPELMNMFVSMYHEINKKKRSVQQSRELAENMAKRITNVLLGKRSSVLHRQQ